MTKPTDKSPITPEKNKRFRITRHNFVKVIVAVYAIIIGGILLFKFFHFAVTNEEFFRRFGKAVLPSRPIEYKRHLDAIRTVVAQEAIDFFERAKERLIGSRVTRMSDLGPAIESLIDEYFDADARRLKEAGLAGDDESAGDPDVKGVEAPDAEEIESRPEAVSELLNLNLRVLLGGLGDLIRAYNAEKPFDTDVKYELDAERTEFVTPVQTKAELAQVVFPDGSAWAIGFDGSGAKESFLGGVETRGEEGFAYTVALVESNDAIVFVDRAEGKVRLLSGNEVLSQLKTFLDAKMPDARAKDRLARAGLAPSGKPAPIPNQGTAVTSADDSSGPRQARQ